MGQCPFCVFVENQICLETDKQTEECLEQRLGSKLNTTFMTDLFCSCCGVLVCTVNEAWSDLASFLWFALQAPPRGGGNHCITGILPPLLEATC